MESPAFSENSIRSMTQVPYKAPKICFDREETLRTCPEDLKPTYLALWRDIDKLDLKIGYYEWDNHKRKTPPRQELLDRFTEEERNSLHALSELYDDLSYLRAKQDLVRLRRSQYPLRDTHQETSKYFLTPIFEGDAPRINCEFGVFPLGVIGDHRTSPKLWSEIGVLAPTLFTDDDLRRISDFVWDKDTEFKATMAREAPLYFDFRERSHLAALVWNYDELRAAAAYDEEDNDNNSSLTALLDTFDWYYRNTVLSAQEHLMIEFKKRHWSIAECKKKTIEVLGKCTHSESYLSAIFSRALDKICETADYHYRTVCNLFFEEEFRTCSKCGRTYLKTCEYFNRSSRNKDGLACKCKVCTRRNIGGTA